MELEELVPLSAKILPKHLEVLDKFDKANQSNAIRLMCERVINREHEEFIQKYLLLFAIGLVVLALAPFVILTLLSVIMYIIGVFYLGYSATKIVMWRLRK